MNLKLSQKCQMDTNNCPKNVDKSAIKGPNLSQRSKSAQNQAIEREREREIFLKAQRKEIVQNCPKNVKKLNMVQKC